MARWGEGDPRWIVEERTDATNVNNWHWTERDVSGWSAERLRRLLLAVQVGGAAGVCQVTDVNKLEGEASINNRKGKLIFFYEWQLTAGWLGTSSGGLKYRGNIEVLNLSDENDLDDLDIVVSLCRDQPDTPLLHLMRTSGVQEVRRVLGQYVHQLRSEFSQGMILPTTKPAPSQPAPQQPAPSQPAPQQPAPQQPAPSQPAPQQPAPRQPAPSQPAPQQPAPSQPETQQIQVQASRALISPAPSGTQIPTCCFSLSETFLTPPDELYRTFIDQELVQVFTRCAAVVDGRCGGRFQLLDGSVSGEFTELVPDRRIGMRWRFRTWPTGLHAAVRLLLRGRGDATELKMEASGVPAAQEETTREGWARFYFTAIKHSFGY